MGSVSFQSPKTHLNTSTREVFTFLSDLDHMESLMPEQVINWQSDQKTCSFDIKGMAHINLAIGERLQDTRVTVNSGPGNPIELQLHFDLGEAGGKGSYCTVTLDAELGMMLQMLASTPLQNLVNIMALKLQELFPFK